MAQTPSLERLIQELKRLPGVGTKTAQRLAYFILRMPEDYARALARAVVEVREKTRFCARCGNLSEEERCSVCRDPDRDAGVICVVQEAMDVTAIERTGQYRGLYHVLHGALSPMDAVGPDELNIASLLRRVREEPVREVILATNPTIEGEATAMYLAEQIRAAGGCRVSRIAHGIPVGGHLEYADEVTLARALTGRREV